MNRRSQIVAKLQADRCTGFGSDSPAIEKAVLAGADRISVPLTAHPPAADAGKDIDGSARTDSTRNDPAATKAIDEHWLRVRRQLQIRVGADAFNSWFGRLRLENIDGGIALHTVPTAFLRSWISSHYRDLLTELWQAENRSVLRVDVAVRSALRLPAPPVGQAAKDVAATSATPGEWETPAGRSAQIVANGRQKRSAVNPAAGGFSGSPLDAKHTLSTFIESRSNRMAYAAARTIAEDQAGSIRFNPLFIHASVGLGKTHLLQAVAWEARRRQPQRKVLYLTAEFFMWRFASAIRDQTALTLKDTLRGSDLLLIDDMQFLTGKAIQAEFCHLLNELIDSARQIVVAADRPPAELESLDERVRSRLKGGVTLQIDPPDFELRKAILNARYEEAKREQPELDIPEDIRNYVARQLTSSGRDLEGAFNQLRAQHQFNGGAVRIEDLDKTLGHLMRSGEPRKVRIEDIQRHVARQFNVSKNEMLSGRRTRAIVRPRQIAMYLSKQLTLRSLPEIGRCFGGRDHTTVIHAVRKIEQLCGQDPQMAREVELLKRLIME